MTNNAADIKKSLEDNKLIIGTGLTIKNLRLAKLSKVYISSNTPKDVKDDIAHYSKLNETVVVQLKQDNEEVGVLCKKPFLISVLGVKK